MKTTLKLCAICALILVPLHLSSQWNQISPKPSGASYYDSYTFSATSIIAVGMEGTIIKTNDGGVNWEVNTKASIESLFGVYFINANIGWAVGTNGEIIKTTDGGSNWTKQISGEIDNLNDIWFLTETKGIIVGNAGIILTTTNGGTTWERKTTAITTDILKLYFTDSNQGFLITGSKVYKTANGGSSWSIRTSNTDDILEDITFIDANVGYATGLNGVLIKTEDAGNNWNLLTDIGNNNYAINFFDANKGIIVGKDLMYKTTDGGNTWKDIMKYTTDNMGYTNSVFKGTFYTLAFADSTKGFILGTSGNIIQTKDACKNLNQLSKVQTNYHLNYINFIDSLNGFVAYSADSILKTTDGGKTWSKIFFKTNSSIDYMKFFSATTGVIKSNGIYKTTNGGTSWEKISTHSFSTFADEMHVVECPGGTSAYYSIDGGVTFNTGTIASNHPLDAVTDVVMLNNSVGYAVLEYDANIMKTTDGGKTWNLRTSIGLSGYPAGCFFLNENLGWVFASNKIFKTIDGGNNFTVKTLSQTFDIKDIYFVNEYIGYAVGTNGYFYITLDGGSSWKYQNISTTSTLNDVYFLNANNGWIVGDNGNIFRFENKPTLTVTAESKSRKYGEDNPTFTFTYSGFTNGDTKANITEPTIACTATKTSAAGVYPITLTGGVSTKYNIKLVNAELTIDKASLTVTAENKSRRPTEANPTYTYTITGYVNGDTESKIDTKPSISCSATTSSPVGTYDIIVSGASDNNYSFTYVKGTLSINNKEAQVINFPVITSKTYGDASFNLTATSSSGLTITYTSSNTDVATVSGSAVTVKKAGTTDITASQAGNDTYNLATDVKRTLTVQKAILTVTAENKTKKEGEANPSFTLIYSGFVNGDNESAINTKPTLTCSANAGSASGTYLIITSGGDDDNYDFNYVNGKLTIGSGDKVIDNKVVNFSIYPNPAVDYINLESTGQNLEIYSILGEKLISQQIKSDKTNISLKGLQSGIYVIKVISGNEVHTARLVKR